ncbi:Crp/Fnr family transcriptional regulator [Ileibacterium valens]|uniref:Cyclic nucleotide-binding domain-containing protein n=2 Tax=Ileibacterium valens TaxID=1862668 RepID=A0A1U7NIV7_9FIRM|nr:Crp/Fnr family transcriptional regulator [Ileibacterium valens]OLU42473.1 hypothetical protein BO224_01855 [Erysipelotrichaceae bacterium NYU-BL-E8]OLU42732.1 hypothetical protein BO222_01115 [Ileibacterium valens]OLU43502.1 hypothetical protein BM735_00170 [Erysipelotrichaceae bacterium NYU-BL-F16]
MITFDTIRFFQNLSKEDLMIALSRLKIQHEVIPKGRSIFHSGNSRDEFAIILSGMAAAEEYGLNEERILLFTVSDQDLLIDSSILHSEPWKIEFRTMTPVTIIRMNFQALRSPINRLEQLLLDRVYEGLIHNARKINRKILLISLPNLRMKILCYLCLIRQEVPYAHPHEIFEIPLDRASMANYLNTDRSALSKELGKLLHEGIIDFEKNRFSLHINADKYLESAGGSFTR